DKQHSDGSGGDKLYCSGKISSCDKCDKHCCCVKISSSDKPSHYEIGCFSRGNGAKRFDGDKVSDTHATKVSNVSII
ncbi:unnamed protein product, partial [Urochloa humidicola]